MLAPGDTFDRYRIEAVLGQGGMGCVYRAHDARLDRRVALKVVLDGHGADPHLREEAKARMLREARAAAALDHPNAISIYDIGEVEGLPYIAMELVLGTSLRSVVGASSPPLEERLRWLADVARALAAAHAAGLVHRDVKPENVMVRGDGRVKVLDFGIARSSAREIDPTAPTEVSPLATLTTKGVQMGTPMYMAPEQIRGERLDGRADQFAWGVLAYELLAGRVPWKGHDVLSLASAILTQEPRPMREIAPQVPASVEAVIARCLAKDPAMRHGSMDEVVRALERALAEPERPSSVPQARASESPRLASRPPSASIRYSSEQLREILGRALESQAADEGRERFTQMDLIDAAREVGIGEGDIRRAARDLELQRLGQLPTYERLRSRQKLLRHFGVWAAFTLFFFLMNVSSYRGKWWFMFPALAWGVGLASHAVGYFFAVPPSPKEIERKRKKKKKDRNDPFEREVEEGVELLVSATKRRMRVDAGPMPAGVRIAPPDEDEVDDEYAASSPRRRRL